MFCKTCGKSTQSGQAVCLSCGYNPSVGTAFCAQCGQPTHSGQVVCTACGFQISGPTGAAGPGKASAVGIITLIGGCWAALSTLGILIFTLIFGIGTFGFGCLFGIFAILPGTTAIMGIIQGTKLIGKEASRQKAPVVVAILQICSILYLDLIGCGLGIANLVLQNDPAVKAFYRG